MALAHSTSIVTNGLAFYYDMSNGKSFVGAPVTNTLPTPNINGLPTIGNGWGTYNTNQYNNNTYFSIGTITSVSSNIVTTSGNHPLRSYDVVTPQTTGGGVSAGTNYLVKKLSNTTFTLHPWNGSQDGSQGFINPATGNHKVYDDFANDVRISVNATSFPTMWWGPPHLANSALVKEIIPQGFDGIPGRAATDCIRLHFNRTDATDGMAYGPDASVTAGALHTVSFWARSVTNSAVGTTGSYQIYNYGATTPTGYSIGYTLGPVGVWQKYVLQFTPNNTLAISYWFPGTGGIKYDIANIQFEAGSIANNFAPGTRSNTQAITDLVGNNTITAQSLTYNNNNTFSFDGINNYLTNSVAAANQPSTNSIGRSWVAVVKPSSTMTTGGIFGHVLGSGCTYYCNGGLTVWNGNYAFCWFDNTNYQFLESGVSATSGQYAQITGTYDPTDNKARIYVNGTLKNTSGTTNLNYGSYAYEYQIGYLSASAIKFAGTIDQLMWYYNKTLTDSEVRQNFNALKGRYLGESPDIPAESGYALKAARPSLPSGYYWIKNSKMPNALRMYVDMSEEGGGYDFYPMQGDGTSIGSTNGTHSGIALGLDLVYPRSKQHWIAMSNFVRNVLGSTGNEYFTTVYSIYRETSAGAGSRGGNYTGDIMRNPAFYGTGAPDWKVPDGGRWWLRDTTFSEPNGDYTAYNFLGGYSLPNPYTGQDISFNDVTGQNYTTGGYYLLSTNTKP